MNPSRTFERVQFRLGGVIRSMIGEIVTVVLNTVFGTSGCIFQTGRVKNTQLATFIRIVRVRSLTDTKKPNNIILWHDLQNNWRSRLFEN